MQLVDTHVHVNFDAFKSDLEETRKRWQAAGVVKLVHSCVEPQEFSSISTIADRFPELFFAVGLHPLDANKWKPDMADQIIKLASSHSKVVAIGETGLDFYKADNETQQRLVFTAQLKIAKELNLPIIVHCRDAALATAQLLQEFWHSHGPVKGVMHCWGGTPAETEWFLDLGFYISFSGTVTFKKAVSIQESAKMVKADRLLIETDCPFLAPVPQRGKRNEPAYVSYVAEQVAKLRGMSLASLAAQTTENSHRLFQLTVN